MKLCFIFLLVVLIYFASLKFKLLLLSKVKLQQILFVTSFSHGQVLERWFIITIEKWLFCSHNLKHHITVAAKEVLLSWEVFGPVVAFIYNPTPTALC